MSQIFKLTLWRVLDGFICIFILAPLVVFYWRGSFQLLDIYTYPSSLEISSYINLSIGILGTLLVNLSQTFVHTRVHGLPANVLQIICKRLYTYLFGWIIVNHWRGVWRLWDAYTGTSVGSGLTSFLAGSFLLLLLKSYRNVVAPPLVTVSDFDKNYFVIKTRFRTKPDKFWIYLLDNLFSVAIPGSLVISVWRGQWAILDHILMSDTLMKSLFISAGLGFGITVLLFFLQWPAALTSQALERRHWNILKIVFEDSFYIVACFAAVNVWRSVWGLCDQLILTDNYLLSNLICHLVGAFGTMILLHGNSVLVRDVQIDGEYKDGKGLCFFSKSLTLLEKRSGLFPDHEASNSKLNVIATPTAPPVIVIKKHSYEAAIAAQCHETERMLQQKLEGPTEVEASSDNTLAFVTSQ